MNEPIPWSPIRTLDHWKESQDWIYHFAFNLPFVHNWSQCECVKVKEKSPTFFTNLDAVFHCWECAVAIVFLRIFVFPFVKKEKHPMGYYIGFWNRDKEILLNTILTQTDFSIQDK